MKLPPLAALAVLALPACATIPPPDAPSEQEQFWAALTSNCGKAYAGRLASTDPRDADWAGKRMVAHWADCSDSRVAIAFHVEEQEGAPSSSSEAVGHEQRWNRSRTWLVTRENYENAAQTTTVFTLKHDHRHEDGKEDAVTQYGGLTGDTGSARAQDFPVDMMSIDLFRREGLSASLTNVWRLEVDPQSKAGAQFVYQLTRRNDPTRLFRVEFDATTPVASPPPAWGWE